MYKGKQKQPSFHETMAVCMFSMNFTKENKVGKFTCYNNALLLIHCVATHFSPLITGAPPCKVSLFIDSS